MTKEKTPDRALSRRSFLKTAGGAAAVAGLATSGVALAPWKAEAATLPKKWDETYDVVVIGSHGKGAMKSLLVGSVTQKIVALSPVPVLVVH